MEKLMQLCPVPAGKYLLGSSQTAGFDADKEGPPCLIELSNFEIGATTVTNEQFAAFVAQTGYVTEAEKFGWSFVFHYFVSPAVKKVSQTVPNLAWWYAVKGADWRHPEGPDSSLAKRMDHPVVQVSRNDAVAFCQWAGLQLPTEAQWEAAAKGLTNFERYPWGNDFLLDGRHHCNIWQGNFPLSNTKEDGFTNTAPAKYYEPNGLGLYQVIGNVWEWCSNPARIDLTVFQQQDAQYFWKNYQQIDDQYYATRGGSFLCHQSYCKRYRIAARNGNSAMSAANNLGFRCVKNHF